MDVDNGSAERLRELLLDLEQAQRRERELRIQSDAILSGLRALSEAATPDELFARVLEALREPLAFDAALVLRQRPGSPVLMCAGATDVRFIGRSWTAGRTFERIFSAGRVVVHLDTSCIAEWSEQPDEVRKDVGSAICIPLRGSRERALLICTRKETRGFQPTHEQMAKRFQPLATQALRDVERIAQIERANTDMRLVLDAVDQGLLTIDRSMCVVGETSATVHTWFGAVDAGARLPDLLARLSPQAGEQFAMYWEQVTDGFLPMECALDALPRQLTSGGRTLAIDLRVIGEESSWTRMLVIVSDITSALERERVEERAREFSTVVGRVMHDREGFITFKDDAAAMIQALVSGQIQDKDGQFRGLHTLKGNTSIIGLRTIARLAHALEDKLAEGALAPHAFDELRERWSEIEAEVAPLLRGEARRGIVVTEGEYQWLLAELSLSRTCSPIANVVSRWRHERVDVMLERLAEQARTLSARLGKGAVAASVEADELRLDAKRWQPVFAAMIHAVRNSLDHGIETEEERRAAGKPAEGRLVFREMRTESTLVLEIEDDGRGIDWAAIRRKAQDHGLQAESHEDLVDALFTDGVSTRDEISEVSGRGVGMSALREATEALGGRVDVDSIRGRGTRLRCVFAGGSARPPRRTATMPPCG